MKPTARKHVRAVFAASTAILVVFYSLIAVTCSVVLMSQGKDVPASINLAWFDYGGGDASAGQLIARYLIVWFPP